jgi:L-ribulose-5-phosphate 4-epimerase
MRLLNDIGKEVITACRILSHRRLVEAFGHFSARIPGTSLFLVSPRRSLTLVRRVSDLVTVDLDGRQVSGNLEAPLEIYIHSCIYRARPDVGAIARTHSFAASVFGALGRSVGVVHDFGAILLGDTPVFPSSELIDTEELGKKLAAFIGSRAGALLRGNGTAILGATPMLACLRAIYLEESAALQLAALEAGEPRYFTPDEIQARGEKLLDSRHLARAGEHYKREAFHH